MTRQRLEQLWDDYRDGSLSEADRAAFDDALRQDEQAAVLFKAESRWLQSMAKEGAIDRGQSSDGGLFAQRVLDKWHEEGAVVGRIGFSKLRVWMVGIAATIVAFIGGAVMLSVFRTEPVDPGKGNIAVAPAKPAPDGVAMLLASASDGYASAAAQPAKLRRTVSSAADMLDVNKLFTLLDPGVPDPARLTKPAGG